LKQSHIDEYLEFATRAKYPLYRTACLLAGGGQPSGRGTWSRRPWAASTPTGGGSPRPTTRPAYAHTILVRTFLSHRRRRSSGERPTGYLPEGTRRGDGHRPAGHPAGRAWPNCRPATRAVVVLRYWEDRSIEETAALLRLSAGAVRTQSSRALARFARGAGRQPQRARAPLVVTPTLIAHMNETVALPCPLKRN